MYLYYRREIWRKGGGSIKRTVISLVLALAMLLSMGTAVYAADSVQQPVTDGDKVVNARIANPLGTNNDCLWKGEASMSNPSGRSLVFNGATYAYHKVDKLGFTLYLQRKATDTGIVSNVNQYTYSVKNNSYAYKAYGKDVTKSGYYRISAIFFTEHSAHQDETMSTVTSWMWID